MKKDFLVVKITTMVCMLVTLIWHPLNAQNIGINATGASANIKALLDVDANGMTPKGGLLVPRLTTTERNAISAPIPESLLIYNTTTQCFEAWNQTVGTWVPFGCIGGCTTPSTTTASLASGIGTSSWAANWNSVSGATSYLMDVSTSSNFASFLSGYNGLNVGNVITLSVNSLTCSTTYYYRIRTINACGTSANSNTITVTTSACPIPTVGCGTQVWAATNLDVGTMVSSSNTGLVHSDQSNNSVVEKYCYNNVAANCTTYGGLYEWKEMMNYATTINCDPCGSAGRQGICPTGYHVPTDLEWSRYEFCLESTLAPTGAVSLVTFQNVNGWRGTVTGNKLKVSSSNTPTWDGTNTSAFSALAAGSRYSNGSFGDFGSQAYYWTATQNIATDAFVRTLVTGAAQSYRQSIGKEYGSAVRCIQD